MKLYEMYEDKYREGYGDRIGEAALLEFSAVKALVKEDYQKAIANALVGILNMQILRNIQEYNMGAEMMLNFNGEGAGWETEVFYSKPGDLVAKLKKRMKELEVTDEE